MIFWRKIGGYLLAAILAATVLMLPETALAKALADQVRDPAIINLWRVVLGIVNVVAILGLIFIAMVNILRIQIETYNIRRMLPTLVLAIILANFSHLICRTLIDFAQILTNFFIVDNGIFHGDINGWTVAQAFGFSNIAINDAPGQVAAASMAGAGAATSIAIAYMFALAMPVGFLIVVLVGLVIIGIPSLLVFVLALMMYVRLYVIWFLVILSPLAFFAVLFDPLKTVWGMWWNWFTKWLFLAPVGFFFLRLAVEIGAFSEGAAVTELTSEPSGTIIGRFAIWIFALGMIFFALYVPFTWGNQIYGALKGALARGAALGWRAGGLARKGIGKRLVDTAGKPGSERYKPSRRWLGQRLSRDYGKAWEVYEKELEKESAKATFSGGLTRHLASGGSTGRYNPADLEMLKLNAEKYDVDHPDLVMDIATGLDLVNTEKYYRGGEKEDLYDWSSAKQARDKLIGFAQAGNPRAYEILSDMYENVERKDLTEEDARAYDNVMSRLDQVTRRRVTTAAEEVTGAQDVTPAQANQRLGAAEQDFNIDPHVNQQQLINRLNQILGHLDGGQLDTAKLSAKAELTLVPEAKIKGMSAMELRRLVMQRVRDLRQMGAIKTQAPNITLEGAKERVKTKVFHEREMETAGRDLQRAFADVNRARARNNQPAYTQNQAATVIENAIQGVGNPQEVDTIRSAVAAKYDKVLNTAPEYQLSEEAVREGVRRQGGNPDSAAARRAETQSRQTKRRQIIDDHLSAQAGNIAGLHTRYSERGKFDQANDDDMQLAEGIFNDFQTRVY